VSNYPGTTVAVTNGRALVGAEVCDIIDTPGVNSLDDAMSEDERITRDVIAGSGADLILQVADARNLRRTLMLTSQLAEFGKPMVLALNVIDEAWMRGVTIDVAAPSAAIGVPVVEMVAVEGRGFPELRDALAMATRPTPLRNRRQRRSAIRTEYRQGVVVDVQMQSDLRRSRLLALGVTPGARIKVLQTFPGIVFLYDQTELAVERDVAKTIFVREEVWR
jgi:Fe2+ transport system protein B